MPRRPLPLLFAALTLTLAACNSGNRDQNDNPPPVPDYQQTHPTADARRLAPEKLRTIIRQPMG